MRSTPRSPSRSRSKSCCPMPATSGAAGSSCIAPRRVKSPRSIIAKRRPLPRPTTCTSMRRGTPTANTVVGHLAAGVPGSVAGLHEAWKRYGKLPWAALIAPAIRLAQGHVIDTARSRDIASDRDLLAQFPASRAQFLVHDSAPAPGTLWRQPDLARTLQLISDSGPDVFYRGQIADLIVAEMQRGGGLITKEDLRNYRAKWRTPIQITYRGHTIYSMPPPSSGGVTMGEILNIMEGYDTLPAFGTAAYVHLLTEAMRRAFVDRNRWLGESAPH